MGSVSRGGARESGFAEHSHKEDLSSGSFFEPTKAVLGGVCKAE
jgi:hypothetical protein